MKIIAVVKIQFNDETDPLPRNGPKSCLMKFTVSEAKCCGWYAWSNCLLATDGKSVNGNEITIENLGCPQVGQRDELTWFIEIFARDDPIHYPNSWNLFISQTIFHENLSE